MPGDFADAEEKARCRYGVAWEAMPPRSRTAAVFHELCLIDTGCRRTGTEADRNLPPCPASDAFIARRNCKFAGRRGGE